MRVLVTGGAGLIGSNLVHRLIGQGIETIVVDNLWRGKEENLMDKGVPILDFDQEFFKYDLTNYKSCLELTRGIDVVIHLADVVAGIKFVFSNQLFVYRNNIMINSNMLNAAIEHNVHKYIYVGTACSYPMDKQNVLDLPPLVEEDAYPANPESAYGWSKLMGEYECELAQKESKIETAVLRLHNVYGPRCDTRPETSQVIPALCKKAIDYPQQEFVVWGSGTQKRAFLYVDDVVDAITMAIESGMGMGVIQIGPSKSHSISDIASRIVKLSAKDIEIKYDLSRPEGDKDRSADCAKAKEILGWQQRVLLEEGLKKTYQWLVEN